MSFKGKKIVITGASPSFGRSLSILFAKLGAELYLSARTLEKAEATARIIRNILPETKIATFQADMSKPEDVANFFEGVKQQTSHIDILINNASLWSDKSVTESDDDEIFEIINSTATGSILATKHCLPLLEASLSPDIIFINSVASQRHCNKLMISEAFSAAKAAQDVFADRIRHRLKEKMIRVITLYPPHFDNPSPLDEDQWNTRRKSPHFTHIAARNVFESLEFALKQDRLCSLDKIVLGNNSPLYENG